MVVSIPISIFLFLLLVGWCPSAAMAADVPDFCLIPRVCNFIILSIFVNFTSQLATL